MTRKWPASVASVDSRHWCATTVDPCESYFGTCAYIWNWQIWPQATEMLLHNCNCKLGQWQESLVCMAGVETRGGWMSHRSVLFSTTSPQIQHSRHKHLYQLWQTHVSIISIIIKKSTDFKTKSTVKSCILLRVESQLTLAWILSFRPYGSLWVGGLNHLD